VGLKGFSADPIFDASLFVELRKRIGTTTFDKLNVDIIKSVSEQKMKNTSRSNYKIKQIKRITIRSNHFPIRGNYK
jgi:hypothetical protein